MERRQRPQEVINWTGGIVAVGLVSILGFVTWALVYRAVPPDNQNALTLLIGILSANVGMIVGFYFGSSSGQKKQADTIDALAKSAASKPQDSTTVSASVTTTTTEEPK